MKLTRNLSVWLAAIALLAVFAGGLGAQAPANQQIRFQGRLTNPGGTPIDTSVNVRFRLFTQPTGGTHIWEETQALVPASTGVFTANLGAVQAFAGVDFSQVLYVALAFNADGDMTPRYLLTGTTLAHHAQNASSLGGLPASAYARLSGAIFTGGVSAPTFTGSLVGNADTATTATNFSGSLAGNVTGPMGSTVVATVGGVTAANVATGANLANASTNLNTANQIVRRDGSGNFSAGSITATTFIGALNGNAATATTAGSATTANSAASFTGSLGGDVTGTQSATQVVNVGGQSATSVANGVIAANAATNANTNNAIVRRDASGNFSAGTITAALNGNASTATTANQLLGSTWAAPQAIGSGTPAAGTFTGLSSSSLTTSGLATLGSATVGGSLAAVGAATLGNDAATPSRGLLAMHDNTASNVFTSTLRTAGALTQNRTVDLPDASGVVVLDTTISSFFSGNFVAVNGTSIMTGNLNLGGQDINNVDSVSASTFFGGGAGITGVNASQLAGQAGAFYLDRANHTGSTPSASLTGALPALNGAALTSLTGANVTGTVASATNSAQLNGQLPAFYLARANHTGSTPSASLTGALPALDAAALTDLTGANVAGTVASATNSAQLNGQLPAFYLARANHTGSTPSASLSGPLPALDGAALTNLTGANVTGPVAAASLAANATLLGGDTPAFYLARANHTGLLPGAALNGVYANEVTLTNPLNAFTGDGAGLTGVNAAALNGQNGNFYRDRANHFGDTPAASLVGLLPALDGGQLTNLTAANVTGTVAAATNALNLGGNAPSFYLDASNMGAGTLLDARLSNNVALRNTSNTFAGDITAAGRGAFTSPLEVNPVGPSFRAHSFEASVSGNGTTPTSSLQARIVGTTAGASEVTGAWLESISDGGITQGVFGQASYSGGVGGGTAIGLDGRARTFGAGPHGFLAIGTAGRADDTQLGSNVGVHAWARNGGKTAGLFAVANATEAEQQTFDASLPAGITAAVLGFNNAAGPDAFGLHVTGANNRIVGDLTVTGTLNASISGTADNANNLGGNAPSFYLDRANHTGSTPSASLSGALPALDGAALTNLSGANVTGAVASATLAADSTLFGANNPAFYLDRGNHTGSTPSASLSGALPVLDGAALTNLTGANVTGAVSQALSATNALALGGNAPAFYQDASNINAGTLGDSFLSANVALLNAAGNAFTGNGSFAGDFSASNTLFLDSANNRMRVGAGLGENYAEFNAVIAHANAAQSLAGEADAGLNVLAVTGDGTTERAIALRGRVQDFQGASTAARQLRGVTGAVNSDGGSGTRVQGGYFFGRVSSAATAGAATIAGIEADAQIDAGATGFGMASRAMGARFGVTDLAGTSISAAGAAGLMINDGSWTGTPNAPRPGPSTGLFGLATGSTSSNVGVFGGANASEGQVAAITMTLPNAGVYAYNGGVGHALMVNGSADFAGNATITGNLSVTGTVNASITGTASDANNLGGVPASSYALLAGAAFTGNVSTTGMFNGNLLGDVTGDVTGNLIGNAATATSAVSFTGPLLGDVNGTQGATSVVAVNAAAGSSILSAINANAGLIDASRIGAGLADAQVNDNLTISGGAISGTPIGVGTPDLGFFTTLNANGAVNLSGGLSVGSTGAIVINANTAVASAVGVRGESNGVSGVGVEGLALSGTAGRFWTFNGTSVRAEAVSGTAALISGNHAGTGRLLELSQQSGPTTFERVRIEGTGHMVVGAATNAGNPFAFTALASNSGTGIVGIGDAGGVLGQTIFSAGIALKGYTENGVAGEFESAVSTANPLIRGIYAGTGNMLELRQGTTPGTTMFSVAANGNVTSVGTVTASSFLGSGAGLTGITPAQITGLGTMATQDAANVSIIGGTGDFSAISTTGIATLNTVNILNNATVAGTVGVSGTLSAAGGIINTSIGASGAAPGTFSNLTGTGNVTLNGAMFTDHVNMQGHNLENAGQVAPTELLGAGVNRYADKVVTTGVTGTSFVITNGLVSPTSVVVAQVESTNLGNTLFVAQAIPTGGQITVHLNAPLALTDSVVISYIIVNP